MISASVSYALCTCITGVEYLYIIILDSFLIVFWLKNWSVIIARKLLFTQLENAQKSSEGGIESLKISKSH